MTTQIILLVVSFLVIAFCWDRVDEARNRWTFALFNLLYIAAMAIMFYALLVLIFTIIT